MVVCGCWLVVVRVGEAGTGSYMIRGISQDHVIIYSFVFPFLVNPMSFVGGLDYEKIRICKSDSNFYVGNLRIYMKKTCLFVCV